LVSQILVIVCLLNAHSNFCLAIDDGVVLKDSEVSVGLEESIVGNEAITIGILDIGKINAGDEYRANLRLINKTSHELSFKSVRPSCTCASFKLIAEDILPGNHSSSPAEIVVKTPHIKVQNAVIGEISIFGDDSKNPIALLKIKGTLSRPVFVQQESLSITLDSSKKFNKTLPILVDPTVNADEVLLSVSSANFTVAMIEDGEHQKQITISGNGDVALSERSLVVGLKYTDEHWKINDKLIVNFLDAQALKIIPMRPAVSSGTVVFKVYRRGGNEVSGLKATTLAGVELEVSVRTITRGLSELEIKIPPDFKEASIKLIGESISTVVDLDL
jgi:hypothetical protein